MQLPLKKKIVSLIYGYLWYDKIDWKIVSKCIITIELKKKNLWFCVTIVIVVVVKCLLLWVNLISTRIKKKPKIELCSFIFKLFPFTVRTEFTFSFFALVKRQATIILFAFTEILYFVRLNRSRNSRSKHQSK